MINDMIYHPKKNINKKNHSKLSIKHYMRNIIKKYQNILQFLNNDDF